MIVLQNDIRQATEIHVQARFSGGQASGCDHSAVLGRVRKTSLDKAKTVQALYHLNGQLEPNYCYDVRSAISHALPAHAGKNTERRDSGKAMLRDLHKKAVGTSIVLVLIDITAFSSVYKEWVELSRYLSHIDLHIVIATLTEALMGFNAPKAELDVYRQRALVSKKFTYCHFHIGEIVKKDTDDLAVSFLMSMMKETFDSRVILKRPVLPCIRSGRNGDVGEDDEEDDIRDSDMEPSSEDE